MATKEDKRIYAIGIKALNLFCDLRDLCYADDIDEFDRLHDDLLYQAEGINESLCFLSQDLVDGGDAKDWEEEFTEALALAREIRKYHNTLKKASSKNFNWIYG